LKTAFSRRSSPNGKPRSAKRRCERSPALDVLAGKQLMATAG
jgi:hypothetical protein